MQQTHNLTDDEDINDYADELDAYRKEQGIDPILYHPTNRGQDRVALKQEVQRQLGLHDTTLRHCSGCDQTHSFWVKGPDDYMECADCGLSTRFPQPPATEEIVEW